MTADSGLEGAYRRLLRWYPAIYRHRHEEEMLGVLMAAAQPGQRRPDLRESFDLLWSAMKIRMRMTARGAGSQPWAQVLAVTGVLIPLLMVVFKLTLFLDRGAQYGFGSPADLLIGAYGQPGAFRQAFQLNPASIAVPGVITDSLSAGPVPALILSVLVCLRWRRAAAAFAAFVALAFVGVALWSGYTLLGNPRMAVTLYAFGLEALILLLATPPQGGPALRWRSAWRSGWRPGVLLAVATVAAGAGMNGGLWPLLHSRLSAFGPGRRNLNNGLFRFRPTGFAGFIYRMFGIGPNSGWGDWLLYQGVFVAIVVALLLVTVMSSAVSRRVLLLLAIPFALGAVMWLCSLVGERLPGAAGNTLIAIPLLLILLAALAFPRMRTDPTSPDAPNRPAAPGDA